MAGIAGTFELGRFTGVCAQSQEPIAPKQAFIAALADWVDDDGRSTLRRFDYSINTWENGSRPDRLVCFWRSSAPMPGEKRHAFVDDETLLEMLQRMESETDARRCAFRWILALVLLRRKVLKLDGIVHEGERESWAFRPRGSDPASAPIRIANPGVREDEVRELADQLGEIIRTDS
ncbi:MAG: hypothetical protein EXS15_02305 [Phycisphaerales bacterium]|nr:hypothetical protein [Phycisphaerales bacterium]